MAYETFVCSLRAKSIPTFLMKFSFEKSLRFEVTKIGDISIIQKLSILEVYVWRYFSISLFVNNKK